MVSATNLLLFLCLLGATLFIHLVSAAPEVRLDVGIVKGYERQAPWERGSFFYAYYGIPFAEPPVGELRFRPPMPFVGKGQNSVISSETFRSACWQAQFPGFEPPPRSEDCLFLNVFTPSTTSKSSLKKVMVWVHGGGFEIGDTRLYIPSSLVADWDVIVVTVQYRLALFGFLSSGDEVLPGNLGLRDQILALEWVKNYISQFGGEPDDVTLFGESAGAASVSILSLSPEAKGLFTKVIMQSGTALSPWAIGDNHEEQFNEVARQTGCEPWFRFSVFDDKFYNYVLDCLMKIKEGTDRFKTIENIHGITFSPVVDGDLIPRDPHSLLQDRDYLEEIGALDRSYVIGVTNNEGGILTLVGDVLNLTKPGAASKLVRASANSLFPDPVGHAVLQFLNYLYVYPTDSEDKIPFQNVLDMYSDVNFIAPTFIMAKHLTEISQNTPVFIYLFDHNPPLVSPKGEVKGMTHGADILYQFDYILEGYFKGLYLKDPNRQIVAEEFGGALAEFSKSGTPKSPNVAWPRYNSTLQLYASVSLEPHIGSRMYAPSVSLWTEFLPKILQMPANGRGSPVASWPF